MKKAYFIHGFQMVGHWFHPGIETTEHGWHTHPRCLSLVYFVKLMTPLWLLSFMMYMKRKSNLMQEEVFIVVFDSNGIEYYDLTELRRKK